MTLTGKAYLVLEDDQGEAVFEFESELEHESGLDRAFIMGEQGQQIREIINNTDETGKIEDVVNRRKGFWIDGGAGLWTATISAEIHRSDDVDWGDGTGGRGDENVTRRDASGQVVAVSRENILTFWMSKSITDSRRAGRLHWGEWTDGRFGPEGVFAQPMAVAVQNHTMSTDTQDPGTLSVTIEVAHITLFADTERPDWLSDDSLNNYADIVSDPLSTMPDH